MRKRKGKLQLAIIIILVIGLIGIANIYFLIQYDTISKVIEMNWNIILPEQYEKIYYTDSGSSFHGDGLRYTILAYEDKQSIEASGIRWNRLKNVNIENKINTILADLNVESELYPDFNRAYLYYTSAQKDHSKIYIVLFEEDGWVYIIEEIF